MGEPVGMTHEEVARRLGAGNSAVVVDVPRCGPMLSPRVSHHVPLLGCAGSPRCALAAARRTSRSSCCATNSLCCADRSTAPSSPTPTGPCPGRLRLRSHDRAEPVAGHPRHAVALAPAPHRRALDPTAATAGPTVDLGRVTPTTRREFSLPTELILWRCRPRWLVRGRALQ